MDYTIIVAGGSGERMHADRPKQFMLLGGLPVLMHTINTFYKYSNTLQIILVLAETEFSTWNKLINEFKFNVPHQLVAGGKSRYHSVKNGLESIKESNGLVAIHDGVRPFISIKIISDCYNSARVNGSGVAAVKPKDSIRKIVNEKNSALNRNEYRLIQTPQTFNLSLIKSAYQNADHSNFTDDASVAESSEIPIHLVEGSYDNIKLTTPEDMIIAQALVSDCKN